MPISTASTDASGSLSPLQAPATVEQIREYLRLSGDMDAFRLSWIAALDKNRSIGAPYWPEEFWTALKAEMQKTDLMPLYVTLYQHGISKALMDEVLDAYHTLGSEHFKGSPACFKLDDAFLRMADDMDKLKLAKTQEVAIKIYDIYKPQIKAARSIHSRTSRLERSEIKRTFSPQFIWRYCDPGRCPGLGSWRAFGA